MLSYNYLDHSAENFTAIDRTHSRCPESGISKTTNLIAKQQQKHSPYPPPTHTKAYMSHKMCWFMGKLHVIYSF